MEGVARTAGTRSTVRGREDLLEDRSYCRASWTPWWKFCLNRLCPRSSETVLRWSSVLDPVGSVSHLYRSPPGDTNVRFLVLSSLLS